MSALVARIFDSHRPRTRHDDTAMIGPPSPRRPRRSDRGRSEVEDPRHQGRHRGRRRRRSSLHRLAGGGAAGRRHRRGRRLHGYIESEVIVKHASNPAGMGIILRGIDAQRAPRVLDLARKMSEGKVEYLLQPQEIPPTTSICRCAGPPRRRTRPGRRQPEVGGAPLPAPCRTGGRRRPGSCWATSSTRACCTCSSAVTSTSLARCAASARPGDAQLKSFRVAGHFLYRHVRVRFQLATSRCRGAEVPGMQGEVTGIEVRTTDPDNAGRHRVGDHARLGPRYEVRSWQTESRPVQALQARRRSRCSSR